MIRKIISSPARDVQSLYILSVVVNDKWHFVKNTEGGFLKSFSKADLLKPISMVKSGEILLRQTIPYDEMKGLSEECADNTVEVSLGCEEKIPQNREDEDNC